MNRKGDLQKMKKIWKASFIYFIAGIVCGVFYREFTKFTGFTGKTTLAFTHLHLLVLGTFLFLIVLLLCKDTKLADNGKFKRFFMLYNIGLPLMVLMLFIRGLTQVLAPALSKGASASISGIAGIAHVIVTVAVIFLFLAIKEAVVNTESKSKE